MERGNYDQRMYVDRENRNQLERSTFNVQCSQKEWLCATAEFLKERRTVGISESGDSPRCSSRPRNLKST